MIKVLLFCFILTSTFTGSSSSFSQDHHHHQVAVNEGHRVVIEFEEGRVSISQSDDSGVFSGFIAGRIKSMLAGEAMRKAGEIVEKVTAVVIGKTIGLVGIDQGTLKDEVLKLEEWDPIDSPKRIGEDIAQNASLKMEQGVEELKETVMETSPNEVLTRSKALVSWCHLLGFSIAYGMGMWVTFFSGCVLGKCLPKEECAMVFSKLNVVYFRAMGCSVGVALLGFLASQGTRGVLSKKMEMFQGFNLVCAFFMILTNLIFFEPQGAKRMKETSETKSVAAEKLKKINAYSSTLNVSTMVVLTWHLPYFGQLLQA